jgi:hypothetical protein
MWTSIVFSLALVWNAAAVAVNVVLYEAHGKPISLGAAIFCGFMFVSTLVTWAVLSR